MLERAEFLMSESSRAAILRAAGEQP